MKKKVAIIDYGLGNIVSAQQSFIKDAKENKLNVDVVITNEVETINNSTHIVLPGQGAFKSCIEGLRSIDGMIDSLENNVLNKKKPFLGICVGMQLLAEEGRAIGIDVQKIVVIPVALGTALFNRDSLYRIIVDVRTTSRMDQTKQSILSIIKRRHQGKEDITVIKQDTVLQSFDNIFNVLTMALGSIASISLLVAGILIMNVMLVAVSQRQAEIGLLKAIGAKNKQINNLFVVEAIMLSGSGAIMGLILGHSITQVLKVAFPDFNFLPPMWASYVSLIVALISGIIFGLLPARRAAKLDPVEALSGNK